MADKLKIAPQNKKEGARRQTIDNEPIKDKETCIQCGFLVSKDAKFCPNCGLNMCGAAYM